MPSLITDPDLRADAHETWTSLGLNLGYSGPVICDTHDGLPATAAEEDLIEDGTPPCVFFVRPYYDLAEKTAIENTNDLTTDDDCHGFAGTPEHLSWLNYGHETGLVTAVLCSEHNGTPATAEELTEFEDGDPCIHIARQYRNITEKTAVEENHAPSLYRQ